MTLYMSRADLGLSSVRLSQINASCSLIPFKEALPFFLLSQTPSVSLSPLYLSLYLSPLQSHVHNNTQHLNFVSYVGICEPEPE